MSKIEQFTEDLTKKLMGFDIGENDFGYVYPQGNVFDIKKISDLLSKAGGKPKECELDDYLICGTGKAKPEFIITLKNDPNTIIVVECKKQVNKHETSSKAKPNGYSVDGVLYYAKYLKSEYNVIAIGVSGTERDKAKLDVYYWGKSYEQPIYQKKLHNIFLSPDNYLKAFKGEKISKSYSLDEIRETAIEFHDKLRTIKVTERQKPIFIAGILIALEDEDFARDYINMSSFNSVINSLTNAIDIVLDDSDISKSKKSSIKTSFKSISNNEKLKQIPIGNDNSITWYIEQLEMKIKPMMNNADSSLDALGVFYHEFVKYSGGDGSGLGIVLTPQHLTEFMCELAEVNENSYVADICCGSGSFLVTAMNQMFKNTSDVRKYENIRKHQLHGIELDADLYVLSIANMIIRRDGKSNIIHGDCFDSKTLTILKNATKLRIDENGVEKDDNIGIDVGLLNPPYSQKDKVELEFIEQLLSIIIKGGKAIVVVPMSCAIGTKYKEVRKRLFEKHTLKAVFSMPDDIFYQVGTNVCVMVWEAHKPHDSRVKTFFGNYKNDGFVKRKKLGRVDALNKWEDIKKEWLSLYRNSDVKDGLSAKKEVKDTDEWLVEAYMKTDYSILARNNFVKTVRDYLSYLVKYGLTELSSNFNIQPSENLNISNWKEFKIEKLFTLKTCKCSNASELTEGDELFYIGAKKVENGVMKQVLSDEALVSEGNCIIFICDGQGSVGYSNYMESNFIGSTTLTTGYNDNLNKYNGLFIVTVLDLERPKYSFGRKYKKSLPNTYIKLPVDSFGEPDWLYMENYIRQLPYADKL